MKIASFNINNIKRRLTNLLDWLREAEPDVVCLQELKATDAEFPAEAVREAGYEAVWRGQKSWNGVAILSRRTPVLTRLELPGDAADSQSRYLEAAVKRRVQPSKRLGGQGCFERRVPGAPLLAIDGDSFAHRSYHALPKTIHRSDGKGAGAILGFANILLRLYGDERPRAVVVGWDSLEARTRRHELFPAYQSGRAFDEDLIEQLDLLPEFVAACGFANAKAPGFEADDFLAAAVSAEERAGGAVLVASGDRDAFQLASPSTTILYPLRAGEIARIGPEAVRKRYGVDPKQVPDFIALRGDPSDKLPGAAGVGPKRAADLVRRHGTLDGVLAAGLFPAQAPMLRLFRSIATMDASAPLPSLTDQTPTWAAASGLARNWGLKQLADRLAEKARSA